MYIPAWLSGFFGKKPRPFKRNGRPIPKSLRVVLDIEQLEKRIVPVVDGINVNAGESRCRGSASAIAGLFEAAPGRRRQGRPKFPGHSRAKTAAVDRLD